MDRTIPWRLFFGDIYSMETTPRTGPFHGNSSVETAPWKLVRRNFHSTERSPWTGPFRGDCSSETSTPGKLLHGQDRSMETAPWKLLRGNLHSMERSPWTGPFRGDCSVKTSTPWKQLRGDCSLESVPWRHLLHGSYSTDMTFMGNAPWKLLHGVFQVQITYCLWISEWMKCSALLVPQLW
jgi:hypothetical protein